LAGSAAASAAMCAVTATAAAVAAAAAVLSAAADLLLLRQHSATAAATQGPCFCWQQLMVALHDMAPSAMQWPAFDVWVCRADEHALEAALVAALGAWRGPSGFRENSIGRLH
jgi:hypothetical protein